MNNTGMNPGIFLFCLVNFGFIALLPRKFFKQNAKLTPQFWLTAAPLFAAPALVAGSFFGVIPMLLSPDDPWAKVLVLIGVCMACISIVLLGMCIGTHRQPIHMFHDQGETKAAHHLVTYGPYRFIRHPIYTSYLLACFAAIMFCPQIGTIACFVYAFLVLNGTAAGEEKRLSEPTEFGDEYVQYMKQTGRFMPPYGAFRFTENQAITDSSKESSERQPTARQ
jgi:protein-S-isoprenylcysteine O-methyltransferase Ste14